MRPVGLRYNYSHYLLQCLRVSLPLLPAEEPTWSEGAQNSPETAEILTQDIGQFAIFWAMPQAYTNTMGSAVVSRLVSAMGWQPVHKVPRFGKFGIPRGLQ